MRKRPELEEILRDGLKNSGLRVGEIAEQLGVNHGNVSRFLSGQQGIHLETLKKILALLNLEIRPKRK